MPNRLPPARLRRAFRSSAGALALLLAVMVGAAPSRGNDGAQDKEAAVRAAFLYRLAFFVSWDASAFPAADSPIRFCIASAGSSRVADLLRGQAGNRKVNERGIAVEQRGVDDALDGCHIVYREGGTATPVATAAQLVVVDSLDALASGGTLALVPERGPGGELRLGFVSRRDRLPNSGVSLSAKLLQLVRFDEGKDGP